LTIGFGDFVAGNWNIFWKLEVSLNEMASIQDSEKLRKTIYVSPFLIFVENSLQYLDFFTFYCFKTSCFMVLFLNNIDDNVLWIILT
jgi:hypothetical protein